MVYLLTKLNQHRHQRLQVRRQNNSQVKHQKLQVRRQKLQVRRQKLQVRRQNNSQAKILINQVHLETDLVLLQDLMHLLTLMLVNFHKRGMITLTLHLLA